MLFNLSTLAYLKVCFAIDELSRRSGLEKAVEFFKWLV